MYYRDLIITAAREDRMAFLTILMTHLHEQFSRHQCAVAFPGWKNAEPNAMDTFDTYTRHADVGDVVRLFAADEASLQELERAPGLANLLRARVVLATPVKEAPNTARTAAFCRVRSADSLGRRVRNATNAEHRNRLQYEARERSHERAYFRIGNKAGLNVRPMFFTRVEGTQVASKLNCNSFGLSCTSELCFLPDF